MLAEVPLTFLLLSPLTNLRRFGAILQMVLQVGIALTGNYTFFNVLTFSLMLPCLSSTASISAKHDLGAFKSTLLALVIIVLYSALWMMKDTAGIFVGLLTSGDDWWRGDTLKLSIRYKHFASSIPNVVMGAMVVVLSQIIMHGLSGFVMTITRSNKNSGVLKRIWKSIHFGFLLVFCIVMVFLNVTSMQVSLEEL